MKTKEEILKPYVKTATTGFGKYTIVDENKALLAMEEYAHQCSDGNMLYWQLEAKAKYKQLIKLRLALKRCINKIKDEGYTENNWRWMKNVINTYESTK
jgi:hypothetical protein